MTYIPPSCDGVGVEVLGDAGELVVCTCVVASHDAKVKTISHVKDMNFNQRLSEMSHSNETLYTLRAF